MERYRSGHNGADSKSVCEQSHMGSNPILSANGTRINPVFMRVFIHILLLQKSTHHLYWGANLDVTQIPVGIILYEMKKGLNKRFFQKKHEKRLIFLSEYGIIRLYFIR